ncbi:MAG TPA: hypothetical protein VK206_18615 [Anaerolineales bacterium]|nr:hypothetical protein [Anaerolineales bacterium]
MKTPTIYCLRVKGLLDKDWSEWFDGMTIVQSGDSRHSDPDGETTLTGPAADQAALYGLLAKARTLGLELISVTPELHTVGIRNSPTDEIDYKDKAMNSIISAPDLIRRRILRIHASFLIIVTVINTILSMVGWAFGKGPFALWQEEQFAVVGLFQAYLIMLVIGIALWFGSNLESGLWKWDLIGLLAHLPPLAVNFIFADLFSAYHFRSISIFSITFHAIFISLELFAILYKGKP